MNPRIEDLESELEQAKRARDRYRRERDAAQVEADRLGQANGDLCDDVAEAGARIRALEEALAWFADEGHYTGSYRRGAGFVDAVGLTKARAALLGMDDDDADAVEAAWREKEGRAA